MEKQQFETQFTTSRRTFLGLAGALAVGGAGTLILNKNKPDHSALNKVSAKDVTADNQINFESNTSNTASNSGETSYSDTTQDSSFDYRLIRVNDLPRDMSLYANTVSPEEVMYAITHSIKDAQDIFSVPPENLLLDDEHLNPEVAKSVFEKIEIGLRVGFDANTLTIEDTDVENGERYEDKGTLLEKEKFIKKAMRFDTHIAQIIAGYSDEDRTSGKVAEMNFTHYFKYAHNQALSRFYDSATAFDSERRSLNETIRINVNDVQQFARMEGDQYGMVVDFDITNVMNISNPPISPINGARGNIRFWADLNEGGNTIYRLSPMGANREGDDLTPFEKIQ